MNIKLLSATLLTQQTFRVLLQALSQPGRVFRLPPQVAEQGWRTVAATLLDSEVTFALLGAEGDSRLAEVWDMTGATPTGLSQADFILIFGGGSGGRILEAKRGSLEYPDQGATLIYMVEDLQEGDSHTTPVRLSGPGIPQCRYPVVSGLDPAEWEYLAAVNRDFPLGVDSFFLDRLNQVMGLPRSTRVEKV